MTWVATAIIGGAIISGGAAAYGSRQAGNAAQRGADAATGESARQFDLIRSDTAPLRSVQGGALDTLASLYGWAPPSQAAARERQAAPAIHGGMELPSGTTAVNRGGGRYDVIYNGQVIGQLTPGGPSGRFTPAPGVDIEALKNAQRGQTLAQAPAAGSPDMGAFFESPDYQFNLAEGQKAIDRSLAAQGRALSGAGVREGVRYASGMASNEYNNFTNRLLQIAGLGSAGVTTSANAGLQTAANIGNAQQNAANTRASGYLTAASGVNNAVQGGISNMLLYQYLNRPVTPAPGG